MKDWILPWSLGFGTGLMFGFPLLLIMIDAPIFSILFATIPVFIGLYGLFINC